MGNVFLPLVIAKGGGGSFQYVSVRFDIAGTHQWSVPAGIVDNTVDVFLVGGGGGAGGSGGGGGYTKAYRGAGYIAPQAGTWEILPDGGRDGNAIAVTPGEVISIIVGAGGIGAGTGSTAGGFSQFKDANYRADGGRPQDVSHTGGNGGSGGEPDGSGHPITPTQSGGSDGGDAISSPNMSNNVGRGQGHTTRDFGEYAGMRNAGGGGGYRSRNMGGESDYTMGSGTGIVPTIGGGGYGGGGGGSTAPGNGGSGTVLIRYKVLG